MAMLDLSINEFRLHEEWKRHSDLYSEWANKEAVAADDLDSAETAVALSKAGLDLAIRKDPKSYDIDKLTEGAIQSAILLDKGYQRTVKVRDAAARECRELKVVVKSIEQRSRALSKMTDLWIRDYYSDVGADKMERVPDEDDSMDAIRKRVKRRIADRERDVDDDE